MNSALPSRPAQALPQQALPAAAQDDEGPFQALLGADAWMQLPPAVRARFGRHLDGGESLAYRGIIATTQLTRFGSCWAHLTRIIGAPLPLKILTQTPAVVLVAADTSNAGAGHASQLWTRIYHSPGELPQVISSMKRFDGPTGLEECVGAGLGMALVVSVEQRALVFRSRRYFWKAFGHRIGIPAWLTPGEITVTHREERPGEFSFTIEVQHRWFGRVIQQIGFFRDGL